MDRLAFFFVSALVLLLTPGPAVLYLVARTIDQGKRAGFLSILGLALGNLAQVGAAALGLSALMLSSAMAFNVVKYTGAAYLIYLGIRKLLTREELPATDDPLQQNLNRTFYHGIVVSLLNPKSTLFFFAFLPQFIDPARGSIAMQTFFLGSIFVLMGLVTDSFYVMLAGGLGGRIHQNLRILRLQRFFAGSVYLTLGILTAFSGFKKH
jgi:threonine/homoserine/homoserine lactone efflux protein